MLKRLAIVAAAFVCAAGVMPSAHAESAAEKVAAHQRAVKSKIAHQRSEMNAPAVNHTASPAKSHAKPAAAPSVAKKQAAPAPKAAPAPAGPTAPISSGKVIEIIIGSQTLRAWQDGRLIMETAVSTGKAGHETPTGRYKVLSKEDRHWSTQYDVWMPYAMRVVRGIFIHELPYTTDGRRLGTTSLGHPVSAGCIRVGIGPAQSLYNWTPVGTPVVIR